MNGRVLHHIKELTARPERVEGRAADRRQGLDAGRVAPIGSALRLNVFERLKL
jgi:hypothetical protein